MIFKNPSRATFASFAAFLLAGTVFTPELHATSGVAVMGRGFNNLPGFPSENVNGDFDLGFSEFSGYTNAAVQSRATASASADFGELNLFNQVSVTFGGDPGGHARSIVKAGWIDALLIDAPGLTGQSGIYNGSVHVHMDYSHTGLAANANYFYVGVGTDMQDEFSAGDGSYASITMSADDLSLGFSIDQSLTFAIPFTFGTPFNVSVTMYSAINLNSSAFNFSNPYAVSHNAVNTVAWGGTASVLDPASNPLDFNDFSLGSTSGTNYLNAIPEPSVVALLAGAGIAVFFVGRGRSAVSKED